MSTSQREATRRTERPRRADAELWSIEHDVRMAASTDVPVLISGNPTESLELAGELYGRSRRGVGTAIVVDCRHPDAVSRIIPTIADPGGNHERPRGLLLLEVHALSPEGQAMLEDRLELTLLRSRPAFRVIASSSAPLFERVTEGAFRERLYYLLNMIHLVAPHYGQPLESLSPGART